MKDFDITFIEVAVAMFVCCLTLWLGTKKDISLVRRIVIVSTVIVLAILIIMAKIYRFESTIFGISNTIETEGTNNAKPEEPNNNKPEEPDNSKTEESDNSKTEESDKGDTEDLGSGGTITDSNNKGFVLNGKFYSYDGKTQYLSDEHQNKVTLSFTQEDVKGWEVVIAIPDGPFGISLVESYSDKIEFSVSSGKYSIQAFKIVGDKQYLYKSIVDIDSDGEYIVDLNKAEYIIL